MYAHCVMYIHAELNCGSHRGRMVLIPNADNFYILIYLSG